MPPPDRDHDCPTCAVCSSEIRALDKRIDQRIVDLEKRLDERYINQKDYNVQHNSLQREMKEQEKNSVGLLRFDELRERVTKVERWPWAIAGIFIVLTTLIGLWLKSR